MIVNMIMIFVVFFGGDDIHNLVELNSLTDFKKVYGNLEWIEE